MKYIANNFLSALIMRYVRIPNQTEDTETATESAREYRNGHRIGQRISKLPPNRLENTESAFYFSIHVISITYSCTLFPYKLPTTEFI